MATTIQPHAAPKQAADAVLDSEYNSDEDSDEEPVSDECDPLVPKHATVDQSTISSRSPGLLALIGPAMLFGIIVKAFDIAFLMTSYSRLASDLQHFKDASWIVLTDSICSAVFVPLYSYLLSAFGTRRMMLVAYAAFALGLGLCAISTTFWQLLASRFAVGIGSSGITLLSMVTINNIVGKQQLAIWEAFVTCVEMGTSMAAGPLGAFMYRRLTWHSVFYVELLFGIGAFLALYFSFAYISTRTRYAQSVLLSKGNSVVPRVDIEGWILLILAVAVPIVAITLGDNLLTWTHPIEILLLVSTPIFICAFVIFEAKVAKNPIINMKPVFRMQFLVVLLQVFSVISILNSITYVIPPYIQVRAFDEHSFEDWALTCVFLGFPAGAIFGGALVKAGTVAVHRIMLFNALLLLLLCSFFTARIIQPETARHAPFLVLFGLCLGVWQSCLLYAVLSSTKKQWWPQTLALYYLVETFGADLGMALMSSIMRSIAKSGIRSSLGQSKATEQIIVRAMRDLESVRLLDAETRVLVLEAFEQAIHVSFFLPCTMAALVFVLATSLNTLQWKPVDEDPLETEGTGETI